MQDAYQALKPATRGAEKTRFLQFGANPLYHQQRLDSGSDSDAVRGENIFRQPGSLAAVSREQVLARQPQAIVIAGDASQLPAVERYWQNQLKFLLLRYMATGLNARATYYSRRKTTLYCARADKIITC